MPRRLKTYRLGKDLLRAARQLRVARRSHFADGESQREQRLVARKPWRRNTSNRRTDLPRDGERLSALRDWPHPAPQSHRIPRMRTISTHVMSVNHDVVPGRDSSYSTCRAHATNGYCQRG